ncbi:hypothetical protein [Burkholderia glumae]|uniref:Uncharacterized protein n=1 Tax=Burkholderia glumae TaxID=337 RepID=A0AAQ0BSJ2_BURGL|nr:hypothetical protein [Burkholderia glumae]AJY63794.1 putative gp36 [Burkholderia glumae LMG 2196 = ATCC 33617]MCM2484308.1 hypothetical protein [Burkholderia glumae]MCM2509999.1 hypothetical protein [Burkholderia glumae]MCM2539762.1 hypothetical protein [Burkholderia glumae]MCR1769581.1 hypothetical protein [Burkholderia glumae]
MARAKTTTIDDTDIDGAIDDIEQVVTEPAPFPSPRLGEQIAVVAGAGRVVINREFGGLYSETAAGPATVDVRVLRLLEDGDLIRQRPE